MLIFEENDFQENRSIEETHLAIAKKNSKNR